MDTTTSQTAAGFDFLKKGLRPTEVIYENQVQKNTDNAKKFFKNEKNWLRLEQAEIIRDKHLDAGASLDEAMRAGYNSVMVAENLPINSEAMLGIDFQVAAQKDDKNWLDYAALGGLGVLLGVSLADVIPGKPIKQTLKFGKTKIKEGTKKLVDVFKNTKFLNDMPVKENTVEVFGKKINLDSNLDLPYKEETIDSQIQHNLKNPITVDTPMNLQWSGIDTYSPTIEVIRNINPEEFVGNRIITPSDLKKLVNNIPENNKAILNSARVDTVIDEMFKNFYQNLGYLSPDFKGSIPEATQTVLNNLKKFENAPDSQDLFNKINTKFLNKVNIQLTMPSGYSQSAEFIVDVYDSNKSLYQGLGKNQTIENYVKVRDSKNPSGIVDGSQFTSANLGKEYHPNITNMDSEPFNMQLQTDVGLINSFGMPKGDNKVAIVISNPGMAGNTDFFGRATLGDPKNMSNIIRFANEKKLLENKVKWKNDKKPSLEEGINFLLNVSGVKNNSLFNETLGRVTDDLFVKSVLEKLTISNTKRVNTKTFMEAAEILKYNTGGLDSNTNFFMPFLKAVENKSTNFTVIVPVTRKIGKKTEITSYDFQFNTEDIKTDLLEKLKNVEGSRTNPDLGAFDIMEIGDFKKVNKVTKSFDAANIKIPTTENELINFLEYTRDVTNLQKRLNKTIDKSSMLPTHGFGFDTVGYVRATQMGNKLFIDELQGDLLQQTYIKLFRRNMKLIEDSSPKNLTDELKNNVSNFYDGYLFKNGDVPFELDTKLLDDRSKNRIGTRKLSTTTDYLDFIQEELNNGVPLDQLVGKIYPAAYKDIYGQSRSKMIKLATARTKEDLKISKSIPLDSQTEMLEKLLYAIILDAKKRRVKYIVLPNVEKIAQARRFSENPQNILFDKNTFGQVLHETDGYEFFAKTADEFLTHSSGKNGVPLKYHQNEMFTGNYDFDGKTPQNFKEVYEIQFTKAVAEIVKKSKGKIKAITGTQDYSPFSSQFSEGDIRNIYRIHKKIKDGKKINDAEKKLYTDFTSFYNTDVVKEPVKIIDITGILNAEDLHKTRIGMAEGGLVNA